MFGRILKRYRQRFPTGKFTLQRHSDLGRAIREARVPKKPGVYIITGKLRNRLSVLYIGMAGKIKTDGTFKKQMLPSRLKAMQRWNGQRVQRSIFFRQRMKDLSINEIKFEWFVTFDDQNTVLPFWAEGQLLQAYFHDKQKLPLWNHEA